MGNNRQNLDFKVSKKYCELQIQMTLSKVVPLAMVVKMELNIKFQKYSGS